MVNNIDNQLLKEMIRGAHQNLMLNKDLVDSLNVFPVPDGDTGTNMGLTMTTVINEMNANDTDNVADTAGVAAKGALKGARGNSGVILSQIIKGMAEEFASAKVMNTKTFAKAMENGSNKAYHAVTQPKEGTILTVIRVMSENALRLAGRNSDFVTFLNKVIKKGNEVLAETPNMLPILKKAGVVDSGGQGLMYILIGMYNVVAGIPMQAIQESVAPVSLSKTVAFENNENDYENIKYTYCTEFFIINIYKHITMSDIDKLRDQLMEIGDCVLVIGDLEMVKVHVHTNNPDRALGYALALGELNLPKIENMREQNKRLHPVKKAVHKPFGLMSICSGKGFKALFEDMNADAVLEGGQTMNPSVEDIIEMVNNIDADVVFVLPNNKNITLACEQAKDLIKNKLVVVATDNVPQGVAAAMSYELEGDEETIYEAMRSAADAIRCIQVTHAVRNTEIDGFKLKTGDIIALEKNIIAKGNRVEEVVVNALSTIDAQDICVITLYYGEDVKEEDADALQTRLTEKYPNSDVVIYNGGQPHYYYFVSVE